MIQFSLTKCCAALVSGAVRSRARWYAHGKKTKIYFVFMILKQGYYKYMETIGIDVTPPR